MSAPAPSPPRARPAVPATPALAAAVVALCLLAVTVATTLHAGVPNEARWRLLALVGACWAVFAAAAVLVRRVPRRAAVPLVIAGAVVLQGVAVTAPPRLTDDYFRYAWDGRVQAAGIDPYRYAPTDPALAGLRDDWLFPPECRDRAPAPCTRMNHPTSPTIYPPVAQAWFWLVHVVTAPLGPDGGGAPALQLAAALLSLATTGALVLALRRRGDPRTAVLWAWCPTVVLEAGNNAHVDVLGALLVALAALAPHRPGRAGAAVGAAVGAKLLPVLVLPALLARQVTAARGDRRRALAAVAALLGGVGAVLSAAYLPHLLAVGPKVLGFLPGYLAEEGFDGERRFALVRAVLPERLAAPAGVAVVAGTAAACLWRHRPERPWHGAVVLVAVALAVTGIGYPWYGMLLVVLVALDGHGEWLAFAAAAYPGYFTAALGLRFADTQRAGYVAAAALVVAVGWIRRRRAGRTASVNGLGYHFQYEPRTTAAGHAAGLVGHPRCHRLRRDIDRTG